MRLILNSTLLGLFIFVACGPSKTKEETDTVEQEPVEIQLGADLEVTDGHYVFFANLEDGSVVTSPFTVEMEVFGMEVEPAGELAAKKGHHHILINHDYVPVLDVIQTDSTHLHFGLGQNTAEITLTPGEYMLSLQFADGFHRSYGEKMSKSIQITVLE